jgi:hypothetical protein
VLTTLSILLTFAVTFSKVAWVRYNDHNNKFSYKTNFSKSNIKPLSASEYDPDDEDNINNVLLNLNETQIKTEIKWWFYSIFRSNAKSGINSGKWEAWVEELHTRNNNGKFECKFTVHFDCPYSKSENKQYNYDNVYFYFNWTSVQLIHDESNDINLIKINDKDLVVILHQSVTDVWEKQNDSGNATGCWTCEFQTQYGNYNIDNMYSSYFSTLLFHNYEAI